MISEEGNNFQTNWSSVLHWTETFGLESQKETCNYNFLLFHPSRFYNFQYIHIKTCFFTYNVQQNIFHLWKLERDGKKQSSPTLTIFNLTITHLRKNINVKPKINFKIEKKEAVQGEEQDQGSNIFSLFSFF
jgi:hypothetical protein